MRSAWVTITAVLILAASLAAKPPVCATVTADQVGTDGKHTFAIQQQLDKCAASGTGQAAVELSAVKGASFTTGPLFLSSNNVLWLGDGVVLNASIDPADFQRTAASRTQACDGGGAIAVCGTLDVSNTGCLALINACKVAGAGVEGPGTIEGHGWSALSGGANRGSAWWDLATAAKNGGYAKSLNAPKMINFQQSSDVTVSGIAIHNAPLVHMLFGRDTGVSVFQVTIVTPTKDHAGASFPYNSDGMDASGSTNVRVDRVDFADGDDNIAFEGGGGGPVRDVLVTNSVFRAGHGLSIGSPTSSGVTNVSASHIVFLGSDNGLRIKSDAANGGVVDQIRHNGICMRGVKNPIVIDPYYSNATGNLLPMFKTVEIDGFYADAGNLTLKALSGQPPLQLTLKNARMDKAGSISAANANITQVSDPKFSPIAIPVAAGVSVTQSQSAVQTEDITSYCQTALALSQSAALANVTSAASYAQNVPIAADSIISIFANGLAAGAVTVIDASGARYAADIFAATPTQINAHMPGGVPPGPGALSVQTAAGASFWSPITIVSSMPALFSANSSGAGVAAAQWITSHADGSQSTQIAFQCASDGCFASPLDLGGDTDTSALVLYATGARNLPASDVRVTIGGVDLQPFYVGPAPGFPGLDQVNVVIPHSFAGKQNADISIRSSAGVSNAVTASFR